MVCSENVNFEHLWDGLDVAKSVEVYDTASKVPSEEQQQRTSLNTSRRTHVHLINCNNPLLSCCS